MALDHLDDTPLPDPAALSPATEEYLAYLASLCEDEQYHYALATLDGIAATIRATNRVTERQREAVRNIIAGAEAANSRRRGERSGSRRYEGFNGRWR